MRSYNLKELLVRQKELLEPYFEKLDLTQVELLLDELKTCRGMLVFTGVGKSGYIAKKIAATLMSTGTKAIFLSPLDALHGDVGMLSSEDRLLILSKSGETDELLQLLPTARNKGIKVIALTSNAISRLAKSSDILVSLPCLSELCPYDLAPTISTTIQLLFGDLIAISLMKAKSFSLSDFSNNHPLGQIGRRATLRVRDLMLPKERTPFSYSHYALQEVLMDLSAKACGCLIIINQKAKLEGIFTDGDLRRALQRSGENVLSEKLENLMTRTPRFIHIDAMAYEALKVMQSDQKRPITVLPVLSEKDEVEGIIKMHDLIQAGL